jgi:hypothetical protein
VGAAKNPASRPENVTRPLPLLLLLLLLVPVLIPLLLLPLSTPIPASIRTACTAKP